MQGDLAELNITSNWFSLLSGRLARRQLLEHLHGDMRVNIQLYIEELHSPVCRHANQTCMGGMMT